MHVNPNNPHTSPKIDVSIARSNPTVDRAQYTFMVVIDTHTHNTHTLHARM